MPALNTAEESPDVLQFKNISRLFDILDVNDDGKINGEDFELFARKICNQLGVDQKSNNGARLSAAYESWWNQLRADMDTDGDGSVSKKEFAAGLEKGEDAISVHSEEIAKIIADMLDTDKDGVISQSEYVKFSAGIGGFDESVARNAFRELDADGDGQISPAELQKGLTQMASKDSSAAGTAILGQR